MAAAVGANRLPSSPDGWAFFFDVDGTLIDIAPTPDSVVVPPELPSLLERLVARTDGATALISGRSLAVLDRLFAPTRIPAAGIHGAEMRFRDGTVRRLDPPDAMPAVRARLAALAARHPAILVEDKGIALALHYRAAPALADEVAAAAHEAAALADGALTAQPGKMVVELRPAVATKAHALKAFMAAPDFSGRRPVAIGDDLTDEHMFAAAIDLRGIAVRVGTDDRDSLAGGRLADPAAVRTFLTALTDA